jgi:hypothetical protein
MATERRKVNVLPAPKSNSKPNKVDSFAVGVTPSHYWFIDALAQAKNKPRLHILEGIITHYIQCVIEKTPD